MSSGPAQFFQPVVVDAEMVGDFVDHRDRDLLDDLVVGFADIQQRLAVDRDGVRQRAARSRSRARSAPPLRTVRAVRLPRGGGLRPETTTLSIAAASSGGIRSSASETSSSNRCGSIRTATRLASPGRARPAPAGGGAPPSGGGGGAGAPGWPVPAAACRWRRDLRAPASPCDCGAVSPPAVVGEVLVARRDGRQGRWTAGAPGGPEPAAWTGIGGSVSRSSGMSGGGTGG